MRHVSNRAQIVLSCRIMSRRGENLIPFHFKAGNRASVGHGRPVGSRSKLQELTLKFLSADFLEHGEETIRRVREKTPHVCLASIVSLLPKQAQKLESPFAELDDDELQRLEDYLTALRAGTIKQIDAVAEAC